MAQTSEMFSLPLIPVSTFDDISPILDDLMVEISCSLSDTVTSDDDSTSTEPEPETSSVKVLTGSAEITNRPDSDTLSPFQILQATEDAIAADGPCLLRLLDLLLLYLRRSKIPSMGVRIDACQGLYALSALNKILLVGPMSVNVPRHLSSGMPPVPSLWVSVLEALADQYADVSAWVDYLGNKCKHSSTPASTQETVFRILNVFFMITGSKYMRLGPLRHVISDTDHVLFDLWVAQPWVPHFALHSPLSAALICALEVNPAKDMLHWIEGHESQIAHRLLTPIATDLDMSRVGIDDMNLIYMVGKSSSRLWNIMQSRGLTGALAHWFVRISAKRSGVQVQDASHIKLAQLVVDVLRTCICSSDGVAWAEEAMKNGVLVAMYLTKEWPRAIRPDVEPLIHSMAAYQHYLSVLRPAAKSITHIERQYGEPFGILNSKAKLLQTSILSNTAAARMSDSWRRRCDFSECPHSNSKRKMRRCDGCQKVYYCSKTCQSSAWFHGDHRAKCKTMRMARTGGFHIQLSQSDLEFLCKVVGASMTIFLKEIAHGIQSAINSDKVIHLHLDFGQSGSAPAFGVLHEVPGGNGEEDWLNVCARFARGRNPVWMGFKVFPFEKTAGMSKLELVSMLLGEIKKGFPLAFSGYRKDEAHV